MRRLLVFILLSVLHVSSALAQDASEAERLREIERLRQEKARESAQLRSRTEEAAAALRRLEARLVQVAQDLKDAEGRATRSERRIASLDQQAERLSSVLFSRKAAISDVLAALQMLERTRPPALVVSPEDANKAAIAAIALTAVAPELRREAERLSGDLDQIEAVRLRAERERRLLVEAETALAERRRLLEELLAERERKQAADVSRLRRIEREDAALAAEATSLRALIEGIAARDRGAPTPSRRPEVRLEFQPDIYAALPQRFAEARAKLPPPASGPVIRRFGDAIEGGGRAQELTLSTRPGAVVTAPFSGLVKWAKAYGALGNIIILDVGDGYSLVLMGLGDFAVRRGDEVRAGEPVGTMPTGGEGALRLHLRRGGEVLDPEPWLLPREEDGVPA